MSAPQGADTHVRQRARAVRIGILVREFKTGHLSRKHEARNLLPAVGKRGGQFHAAGFQNKQPAGGRAFVNQHRVGGTGIMRAQVADAADLIGRQAVEYPPFTQDAAVALADARLCRSSSRLGKPFGSLMKWQD